MNKIDTLENLLNNMKQPFSVITLTETWLTDINSKYVNKLRNYDFINLNGPHRKGGGIGIFVSKQLNYKLCPDLNITEDGIIESLFIEIISKTKKNMIIGTIYRPPSSKFDLFESKLNTVHNR